MAFFSAFWAAFKVLFFLISKENAPIPLTRFLVVFFFLAVFRLVVFFLIGMGLIIYNYLRFINKNKPIPATAAMPMAGNTLVLAASSISESSDGCPAVSLAPGSTSLTA